MKTIYLDLFSGVSGDMLIGALLDLGADLPALEIELRKLKLDGYHLHTRRDRKCGIAGVKFDVHCGHHEAPGHEHHHRHDHDHPRIHERAYGHEHHDEAGDHAHDHDHGHREDHTHAEGENVHGRSFKDIRELIAASDLSPWIKEKSTAVFHRIARAEGQIHGMDPDEVHFHEVGAIDSIVDIVGACVCLDQLGRPRVIASRVVEGTGWIRCAHGNYPIPAPATLAILGHRGVAITQCDEPHELVTPTGAALLAEFAEKFGPMANLAADRIGIGLGTRDNHTRPNVLRAILSEEKISGSPGWEADTISAIETNLDDMTAELFGGFLEKAMASGALDVFFEPIQMKKNRPGVKLTVLCAVEEADRFTEMVLRETSAFGARRSTFERRKLAREFAQVKTPFGEVTIKLGRLGGDTIQAAPEFESCRKLAGQTGIPVRHVFEAARIAAREAVKS
jgi:uncharacterized protein (TIGR00299 family) protein